MRESGLLGFFRIVFHTVTDGYNRRRAWLVTGIMTLILLLPLLVVTGIALLIF